MCCGSVRFKELRLRQLGFRAEGLNRHKQGSPRSILSRKCSTNLDPVFIYLNDLPENDGGETFFPELGWPLKLHEAEAVQDRFCRECVVCKLGAGQTVP